MEDLILEYPDTLVKELIRRIERIEDGQPLRKGMEKTPQRVVQSWAELFSGYSWTENMIRDMLTQFDEPCNQMVVLRKVEFVSTCEHHWMPFEGVAHIGYVPNGKTVVGISKLARLLEVYARRFQLQERINQQVVEAIDKYVKPKGSACILVAKHSCIRCRGIGKQHSEMITSARTGCYQDSNAGSWREFQTLIKL